MRRMTRTAGGALAAGVLLIGLAACGDDDDTEAAADESTDLASDDAGATEEFCDAAVAVDAANLAAENGEAPPRRSSAAMEDALDLAPEAIAADAEALVTEARAMAAEPETEEGPPPIPSDEYFAASVAVGGFMADNCGLEAMDITAEDYTFDGFPETVPAGTTLLELQQRGHRVPRGGTDEGGRR